MNNKNIELLNELSKNAELISFDLSINRVRCKKCFKPFSNKWLWIDESSYTKQFKLLRNLRTQKLVHIDNALISDNCIFYRKTISFKSTGYTFNGVVVFICECDCGKNGYKMAEHNTRKFLGR